MKEMDDGKLQMYDRLANCYNDAIKLVKDDIAQLKVQFDCIQINLLSVN